MKQYQKPLLTVETLLADEMIAFDIIVSGDGENIYDDDDAVFDN